jgi:hypothetical protein
MVTPRGIGFSCVTKVEVKFKWSYPGKNVIHMRATCSLKDSQAGTALHALGKL